MVGTLLNVMVVYFLFIAVLGDRSTKLHSIIIFIYCAVFILFPLESATTNQEHISNKINYLMYEGATALILSMFLNKDKVAWKHASILCFAMVCHIMIILHLSTGSYYVWAISKVFYSYYKELILTIGILQMMVSHDGLISAFSNLQELLLRTYHHFIRNYQSLFTRKSSEKSK